MPILIRAAKCMPVTATEVSIKFRRPPHDVFGLGEQASANGLRFRINPENRVQADSLLAAGETWHDPTA